MRVMSYNLRFDNASDNENRWSNRESAVKWVWNTFNPDLVGIQEGLAHQVEDLNSWFDKYTVIGRGREADFGGERVSIFFKSERFKLLDHGDFWLSETPEVPGSKSWDTNCPRMATWALLQDDSNIKTLFLNTHLDHVSHAARINGSNLIRKFVKEFPGLDGVVITGDLNDFTGEAVQQFTEDGAYVDALAKLGETGATFHNFTGSGMMRIDFILTSPSFEIEGGRVVLDKPNGIFPSDHFPIYVDLESKE